MSVKRIASRYAKSLIDLAKEQNALEDVFGDVQGFLAATENRDLELLIKSPIVHAGKKLAIFKKLFGESAHKLTNAFFDIVIRKGREPLLVDIAGEFIEQYKEEKKITSVKVITAQPLDEAILEDVRKQLSNSNIAHDNIELETELDESLIGGFVIEIGDKRLDSSVAHRLKSIANTIIEK